VPRFTADVLVEADRPVSRLSSSTHRALVDGLGENTALLSVPDGFVYRQSQLAVEFELAGAPASRPVAALDRAPADGSR
jgi:signal transduction histidine kinase